MGTIDSAGGLTPRVAVLIAALGGGAGGAIAGWVEGDQRLALEHGAIGVAIGLLGSVLVHAVRAGRRLQTDADGTTTSDDDRTALPPVG